MTSTRRTNLFRITAVEDTAVPVLSVGLVDLSESTSQAFVEIRNDSRVVGNGTFKPSFGEGTSTLYFSNKFQVIIHYISAWMFEVHIPQSWIILT